MRELPYLNTTGLSRLGNEITRLTSDKGTTKQSLDIWADQVLAILHTRYPRLVEDALTEARRKYADAAFNRDSTEEGSK